MCVCVIQLGKKTMNHRRVLVNELRITKAHVEQKKGKTQFLPFSYSIRHQKIKKNTHERYRRTHWGILYSARYDSALIIL